MGQFKQLSIDALNESNEIASLAAELIKKISEFESKYVCHYVEGGKKNNTKKLFFHLHPIPFYPIRKVSIKQGSIKVNFGN